MARAVDVGLFRSTTVEDVRRFTRSLIDGEDREDGMKVHEGCL